MSGIKSKSPITGEFSFERFSGVEVNVSYVYSPGNSEDGEHIEWLTNFNPPLSDDEADHLWACISDRVALEKPRALLQQIIEMTIVPISAEHAAVENGKTLIRAKSAARKGLVTLAPFILPKEKTA